MLSLALLLALAAGIIGVLLQAHRANRHARETQLNLYAADMSAASHAIERGDFGLGRRLLNAYLPAGGAEDFRGFEWHYLWNRSRGNHLATLLGHPWIVTRLAYSSDGLLLASGSQATLGSAPTETTVNIWDPIGHKSVHSLPTGLDTIWSLAFSPDDRLLVTAGSARQVRFWNTKTWESVGDPIAGQFAALSRRGSLLAVVDSSPFQWEAAGKVQLWDYGQRHLLADLAIAGRFLVFSPDDRWLAIAGPEKNVLLWNVQSGVVDRVLETPRAVWMASFSPSGDRIATVGWDSLGLVFDTNSGDSLGQLAGHSLTLWSVGFSPDGRSLVTTGSDQTIRLWDASTFNPLATLRGHENEVWCAAFSPDGHRLASGGKDRTVRLWSSEISPVPILPAHEGELRPYLSPDGSRVLAFAPTNGTRRPMLWQTQPPRLICEIQNTYPIGFSTDGKYLVRLHHAEPALEFFEPPNGLVVRKVFLQGHSPSPGFQTTGFSPRYDFFFGLKATGRLDAWDAHSGQLVRSFSNLVVPIRGQAMSPDGRFLALSSESSKAVHLYDLRTGRESHLEGHHDFVSGLAFAPDSTILASGSMDAAIKLWDPFSGREVDTLLGHMEEATDLSFSPDGRTLASLGKHHSIKFWNLITRREVASIDLPEAENTLRFSPDSRFLLVSCADDVLRFLEAPR
jgi:WD40 repeat protein